MADIVSPIVDIISCLWPYCARHTSYICKLQENKILLRNAMAELKEARDDVQRRVVAAESDPNDPKKCTDPVSGWLQRVETIEGEVEVILQKAGEQLSRARSCLGGCCPPNNCWSNYKVGKSIAEKIPLVKELKVNGKFEEVTYVARPTNYLSKLQENKILLRNAMAELKNMRNDVQRKVVEAEDDPNEPKMRTDQVRGWLQRVETIDGEVEVILQTSDEQLSNTECHEKDKLVVMQKAYVDELKVKGKFEEVTYRLPPPSVQDMNLESTVGMESMFDKVWRLLTSTYDKPVRIMGLYGQGGVGKTTLLQNINNEFKRSGSEHGFDHVVIFVVVSKPINYEAIQKKIGERLGLKGDGDESSRADKIFNVLSNKNFVILLDDIWERVDLRRIGIPIIHPQGKSKLIFTTRSERVCGEMEATHTFQVECLPWDKAWSLFQEKVGEKALNYLSGAHELAKDVAKECGGLPLALITIGRAMSTKKSVQEWRDAIATLRRYASKFQDMRDKVLPRLKMSYDNLPSETEKSCFRYCALFPEDYSIEISKLVDYWIAEGFLDGFDNNLDEARDRGHTIIGSLKSACLLECRGDGGHTIIGSLKSACLLESRGDRGHTIIGSVESAYRLLERRGEYNRKKTYVKMHDVIRDLALWIVNDCSSNNSDNNNNTTKLLVAVNDPCKKWENAERIFWDATGATRRSRISNEEENPPTSPNLLTLIVKEAVIVDRCSVESRTPPQLPNPRLLAQSFFQHMPHLRVLDLSNGPASDGKFPISICELHELQYLNLSGTDITELPVELSKLVKLKFLILYDTYWLRRIPAGLIASLSELQVLDVCSSNDDGNFAGVENWELGEDGPTFSELDGLQEVRITITTFVALEKFLCNRKLQMVCTRLKFRLPRSSSSSSSSSSSRRVLDLSNFKSLKDLNITGFGFLELEELVLSGSITTDGGGGLLSNLETLTLHYNFPKLNSIRWMMAAAQPRDLLRQSLLHYIQIIKCDALKDLTWLVYVQNLERLVVQNCTGLETIIELGDDDDDDDQMLNTGGGGGGGGGGVFRRLKTLELWDLPKLKSICRHALAFPSIEAIHIHNCPELKKLPLGSGSNVKNTLVSIEGSIEWWNELQWEDETIKSKFRPYLRTTFHEKFEYAMKAVLQRFLGTR